MAGDLLNVGDFLKSELDEFSWAVRRGGDITTATVRLQGALSWVEGHIADPGQQGSVDRILASLQQLGKLDACLAQLRQRQGDRALPLPLPLHLHYS